MREEQEEQALVEAQEAARRAQEKKDSPSQWFLTAAFDLNSDVGFCKHKFMSKVEHGYGSQRCWKTLHLQPSQALSLLLEIVSPIERVRAQGRPRVKALRVQRLETLSRMSWLFVLEDQSPPPKRMSSSSLAIRQRGALQAPQNCSKH